MKKTYSALLAVLFLALFSVTSQAQTTNFVIYNFNTNQVAHNAGWPFGHRNELRLSGNLE